MDISIICLVSVSGITGNIQIFKSNLIILPLCEPGIAPAGGEGLAETELRAGSRSAVDPAGEHEG